MKNNYFGFSGTLFKENIKRHWYVPAIVLIFYFFSVLFEPLRNFGQLQGAVAIENSLKFCNVGIIFVMLAAPVIIACIMMSFYHKQDMAFAIYSQPYSISRIFNTGIITGWLMMIVPMLITGVILMLIKNGMTCEEVLEGTVTTTYEYTIKEVLIWIVNSVGVITFMYGLYVLAGSLSGNTVIQVLGCGVFFALIPTLVGIGSMYADMYLEGFNAIPDWADNLMLRSNPIIGLLYDILEENIGEETNLGLSALYIVTGLIMIIISKYACSIAKLERIGDAMIFKPVETILTVIMTFVGACVAGSIFEGFFFGKAMMILGCIIGAAISFFVIKIIMEKSVKVFNMRSAKTFGISIIVLSLFLMVFAFDITGYAGRLVDRDRIESINCTSSIMSVGVCNYGLYGETRYIGYGEGVTDPEIIDEVYDINQYIIDNNLVVSDDEDCENGYEYFDFEYSLKNGNSWSRTYRVNTDEELTGMVDKLISNEGYYEAFLIGDKLDGYNITVYINIPVYGNDGMYTQDLTTEITDEKTISGLFEAIDKDIINSITCCNDEYADYEGNVEICFTKDGQAHSIFKDIRKDINPNLSSEIDKIMSIS